MSVDDLVLVAEFRDRIYPGLRPDGTIERGGEKPFHTVINGENFHVLEQLTFTHEHAVDAIYIDPPYNTGSKDWKYNNDYVEGDDLYRHSKWLAFMERRLKMAKRLLRPDDSVLIVTIDEREGHRLALLLEQVFPEARIQMVSSVINPKGVPKARDFSRVDEWLFFVMLGSASPGRWTTDMMIEPTSSAKPVRYVNLKREGSNWRRADRPGLFYPIYVDPSDGQIVEFGEPIPAGADRHQVPDRKGSLTAWPIKPDGSEARWQQKPESARALKAAGLLRSRLTRDGNDVIIDYLSSGQAKAIEEGRMTVAGRDENGALIIDPVSGSNQIPKTLWRQVSHSATEHGTKVLTAMIPNRAFPFPKALYAVEDSLRFFLKDKPEAVVLDFFSGSGTTAHAVMRLNKQDEGRRQCISVTNNEASAEEQAKLRARGLRQGDPEWERWGICDYITKPRIRAAITGLTPEGSPIKGDYKFADEFPMADGFKENAAFFTLTYESPWMVSNDKAFAAIAPMLWLRAGAQGERIDALGAGWAVADTYGVLRDLDQSAEFVAALKSVDGIRIGYIVTDDEGRYQQVADELRGIETVRLYEDYLRNCESTGDL